MNIPKKVIGWMFFVTGFAGGMLLGYLQFKDIMPITYLLSNTIMWIYAFIYIGFLASWFALYDYAKKLEVKNANTKIR